MKRKMESICAKLDRINRRMDGVLRDLRFLKAVAAATFVLQAAQMFLD